MPFSSEVCSASGGELHRIAPYRSSFVLMPSEFRIFFCELFIIFLGQSPHFLSQVTRKLSWQICWNTCWRLNKAGIKRYSAMYRFIGGYMTLKKKSQKLRLRPRHSYPCMLINSIWSKPLICLTEYHFQIEGRGLEITVV